MVAGGGTINFLGKFHNIKLSMGQYVLNSYPWDNRVNETL